MPEFISGVRTSVELVSKTHGIYKIPLVQSFDYTPNFTERTINEFDNLQAAAVLTSFDGVDVKFDYLDSDSKLVDAAVNDQDPSGVVINDPGNLQILNVLLNVKNTSGDVFEGIYARAVRIKSQSSAEPVKEESTITIDGSGTSVFRIKAHGLLYSRVLAAVPDAGVYDQDPTYNSGTDGNFSTDDYTFTEAPVELPYDVAGFGTRALMVRKNGAEVTTGYTIDATKVTLDDDPLDTDVWEFITIYLPS